MVIKAFREVKTLPMQNSASLKQFNDLAKKLIKYETRVITKQVLAIHPDRRTYVSTWVLQTPILKFQDQCQNF